MILQVVPIINIAPFRLGTAKASVAKLVDQACRDIGFLVISGHGVQPALIEAMHDVSRHFFDLPLAEKMRVARPAPEVPRGYMGFQSESLSRTRDPKAAAGDLNESLTIGPVDPSDAAYASAPAAGMHFAPNLWPERPCELRAIWTDYYRAMDCLATDLMRIFALGLGMYEGFFDTKIDRPISRLRVRNFPALSATPLPGQLRAGAHSDSGSVTILATEDTPGGMQVRNGMGEWVDVPVVPGTFIINIGDLMARWTNDAWVSTLHRVANPPLEENGSGAGNGSRRQSLVFIHTPNYDAPITCIPTCLRPGEQPLYPPTTPGEHLRRLRTLTNNAAAADH